MKKLTALFDLFQNEMYDQNERLFLHYVAPYFAEKINKLGTIQAVKDSMGVTFFIMDGKQVSSSDFEYEDKYRKYKKERSLLDEIETTLGNRDNFTYHIAWDELITSLIK